MISKTKKNSIVEAIQNAMEERKEANLKDLALEQFMADNDIDLVKKAINKINANVVASLPEGIPVPGTNFYITGSGSGNEITVVNMTVKSKVKAAKSFKYAKSFVSDDIVDTIADFLTAVYVELVVDYLAELNLAEVNELLEDAAKQVELPYKVSFTSAIGGTNKKIAEISDEEVIFYADDERVFELEDLLALKEPDDIITEDEIADAKLQVMKSLEGAQTPEQLVEARGGIFVGHIANINKNMKPAIMIKKVCNLNAENINTDKDLTAYYLKDNVFALVAQRDGQLEVLLSPFDLDTFHKVDVDVLAEIGK